MSLDVCLPDDLQFSPLGAELLSSLFHCDWTLFCSPCPVRAVDRWHGNSTKPSTCHRPHSLSCRKGLRDGRDKLKHQTCSFKGTPSLVASIWPVPKVMGDSESFNWCFMGSMALCAELQHNCTIPLWTDMDSISDYRCLRRLKAFLSGLSQSITSALFTLVRIYMWRQIVHYCVYVKILWRGYGKVYCFVYCSRAKAD